MATGIQRNKNGLPEFTKASRMEWKRKMLVFSIFLMISIIIWTLNALSKNYTTEIKYPITYSRFPERKILISDIPDHLRLKVNAHGYELLSYKISTRPVPINFPVTSFAMNRLSGDTTRSFLLTRYAREQVARQLPADWDLLEIYPDTLFFQFARQTEKMVPVRPVINFELARDFTLMDRVVVSPESILVSGPDIYLDTLNALYTQTVSLGVLAKSYEGELDVAQYKRYAFEPKKVSCSIQLEKLTEVQVEVPIQITGLPDSLRMETFPHSIKVTGKVGLSKYDRIIPEAFWFEVNYSDVQENKSRLQVYMKTRPMALTNVDYYPQTVEYLLSVK